MKKYLAILFIVAAIQIINCDESKIVEENRVKDFRVEVIRYYFGRENIRVALTPDKVTCETSLTLNRKDYSFFERGLGGEEKSTLEQFLKDFPLEKMKESYFNKGVKDGMQIRFIIQINGMRKNIYVANYYIEELGELVSVLLNLLPEDHLNYNPERVPAVIGK